MTPENWQFCLTLRLRLTPARRVSQSLTWQNCCETRCDISYMAYSKRWKIYILTLRHDVLSPLLNREIKCSGSRAAKSEIWFFSSQASAPLGSFLKPKKKTALLGDKFHTMLGLKDKAEVFLRHISHVMISSSGIRFKQRSLVIHFLVLR